MPARARRPEPAISAVAESVQAHDALLSELFRGLLPLLAKSDEPLFIRVFIIGLIFLGVFTSLSVVLVLADVVTSFASRRIDVQTYLGFFAAVLGVLLLAISIAARSAQRFENEKALEANLRAVTHAHRQRQRDTAVAANK